MLLADFCKRLTTRAPVDRPILRSRGFRLLTACLLIPFGSGRASPRQTVVSADPALSGHAFDDAHQLRSYRAPRVFCCRPFGRERRWAPRTVVLPRRGVFNRARGWRPISDVPCRPAPPFETSLEVNRRTRTASVQHPSRTLNFPGSRRLPSTSAPPRALLATPRFLPKERNPPPISRLCHQRFGFQCCFTQSAFSRDRARSFSFSTDSSPMGVKGHALLVDFCNRSDLRAQSDGSSEPRPPHSRLPACDAR